MLSGVCPACGLRPLAEGLPAGAGPIGMKGVMEAEVGQCQGHVWSQRGGAGARATVLPSPAAYSVGPCL